MDGDYDEDDPYLFGGGGKGGGGTPNGGYSGGPISSPGSGNRMKTVINELLCLLDMLGKTLQDGLSMLVYGGVRTIPNEYYCFVAGTVVHTEDGWVSIENIQLGDMVWAWDEETGEVALKEVVETYINETDELVHLFVNGEEIVCTPSHPFYAPIKGWTDAVKLRAGDILILVNGEYVVVEKVQHEILESPVTVYNFQVEDYHTYYVANAGVLVHNYCSQVNTTTEWDTHYKSQGQLKVGSQSAQFDGKYYWLTDTAGHGGSYYKVYEKSGKYLYWRYDADIYGNFIYGKHKGDTGLVIYVG